MDLAFYIYNICNTILYIFMILYTDDDIPIIYNPIQINDEKNVSTKEPSNSENNKNIPIPKQINVNIIVRFICCCFHKNPT